MINVFKKIINPYLSELKTLKEMFQKKEITLLLIFFLFFVFAFFMFCVPREPLYTIGNIAFILMCIAISFYLIWNKKIIINIGVIGLTLYLFLILIFNLSVNNYALSPYVVPIIMIFIYELTASIDYKRKRLLLRLTYIVLLILLVWSYLRYFPEWLQVRDVSIFNDSYFDNLDVYTNNLILLIAISLFYLREKNYLSSIVTILTFLFILITERRIAFLFSIICFIAFLYSLLHKKHPLLFYILTFSSLILVVVLLFSLPALSSLKDRLVNTVLETLFTYEGNYAGDVRYFITIRGFYYAFTNMFGIFGYDSAYLVYGYTPSHDLMGDLALNYGGLFAIVYFLFFMAIAINMIKKGGKYRLLVASTGIMFIIFAFLGTFIYSRTLCIFGSMIVAFIPSDFELQKYNTKICVKKRIII